LTERHLLHIRDRHGFERTVPISRTVTLGRQNQCDIVLSDSMVSRSHLRLDYDGNQWWIEDMGSSHGTFFREEKITRMAWPAGATIRLADDAYLLTLSSDSMLATEVNLQAILQTAQLLTGDIELDDLLEQSLDRLLTISRTDRGFIMLPEHDDLVVKVRRNLGSDMEKNIHLSMSSVRKVFEQGEPIWIHNVAADEALMAQQSIMDLQLKTILCLPLTIQGRRIGVVYLDSRKIITEPVDRATFEAIVSIGAIAIERARLAEDNVRNQVLATVGQVASSIVHDFKNALFVVAGHAQLLGATQSDPNVQHHVEQILAAVERLSQLSTDVVDYSKVREPHRELVNLGSYLESLMEPLRLRANDLGASLRCDGPLCEASIDKHRFARVIENLLSNSLDAIAKRQEGEVSVGWEKDATSVRIFVQDNGPGIPKKVLKRIFEPFFSHGKAKGTGLGMATVKKIVEEHGGTVEVQTEEGHGTTVILDLPAPQLFRKNNEDSVTGVINTLSGEKNA
jgi:signal transduction histidine kinase